MSQYKNIENKRFGRLLVLSKFGKNKHNKILWNTICDCGTTKIVIGTSLNNGTTQSCGCLQKEKASQANKKFDSNPALRKLIDSYRNSAKKRGYNFSFSVEESDKLFQRACFYCNRLPHRIFTEHNGKYNYSYNGIDRIDNNKDYTLDNVYTCCKDCNYAKNEMSIQEFSEWIIRVYNFFIKDKL
jgi:hypothetical protein